MLIAIIIAFIPKNIAIVTGNIFTDTLVSGLFGSIAAGNPITSYIIGGELLQSGVSLVVITAFLLTWVTVGIIQFPAESYLLGKRFAVIRNLIAFFSAIVIAFLVLITMSVI